jgi:hypothetical protein
MGRRRAGHGWSVRVVGNRLIHVLANDACEWVPTGRAAGWRRCRRCRAPFENDPFESRMCHLCYFYHDGLPSKEFWKLYDAGYLLHPYSIGQRLLEDSNPIKGSPLNSADFTERLRAQEATLTINRRLTR